MIFFFFFLSVFFCFLFCFFFQAEDGIRYLVRSRGLGDVYKRQELQRHHLVEVGRVLAIHDRRASGVEERGRPGRELSLIHI